MFVPMDSFIAVGQNSLLKIDSNEITLLCFRSYTAIEDVFDRGRSIVNRRISIEFIIIIVTNCHRRDIHRIHAFWGWKILEKRLVQRVVQDIQIAEKLLSYLFMDMIILLEPIDNNDFHLNLLLEYVNRSPY